MIHGLEQAFNSWNLHRFRIFWNTLLSAPRIISGEIRSETNKSRLSTATPKLIKTEVSDLCQKNYWMPDKAGNWHKPNELLLTDLPNDFDTDSYRAKEVSEKLGMKKPEIEKVVEELSKGDSRKKALFEIIANAPDDILEKFLQFNPQIRPPQPAPSFKTGFEQLIRPQLGEIIPHEMTKPSDPINNPERYQNKVDREAKDNLHKHETTTQTVRFQVVREAPSNADARQFLYEQYKGKCQISGSTFPKASANADGYADNYFESCALVPNNNAEYLNDAGNMLCVSADTMAKLKYASFELVDDLDSIISKFSTRQPHEIQTVEAKIRLCGEECAITWSERHFAKLVALWNTDPG